MWNQDPSTQAWTSVTSYPTKEQIEEMFIVANYMNATVIRAKSLGITSGDPMSLRPTSMNPVNPSKSKTGVNFFNDKAWDTIDYAFFMAARYNIRLIIPLIDSYNYYLGNYGDFSASRGVTKAEFFTSPLVRADFKLAIHTYLNHYGKYSKIQIRHDPALFMIELGNELGNIRPDATSTAVPPMEWISEISIYIKSYTIDHIVLNGADESLGQSSDFLVKTLDTYSNHFYWVDSNRLKASATAASKVSKPFIIGEFASNIASTYFPIVESQIDVQGSLFWSLLPHVNGTRGGGQIPHNDGYSVYFPESMSTLLPIANHFQRMRGVKVTSSIGPGVPATDASSKTPIRVRSEL